jgi:MtN3 and saliva related transmembrane protein
MINSITILGLLAATFTTACLIPQLMKVWKTRSTKDISAGMYALYCGGVFLWLIYGLYQTDLAIIIANSLALVQGLTILMLKAKFK